MASEHEPLSIETVPVALLSGGLATRLGGIAKLVPKALMDIDGRPFIDYQLALLRRNGIRRVVLCVGYLGEQIQRYVGDGAGAGLQVSYSFDGKIPLGTGGALRRAAEQLGDVFWVIYGDSYMDIDYGAILVDFVTRRPPAMMTVLHNEGRWDRSNVEFDQGRVLRYDKKNPTPAMRFIDYGAALLSRQMLERIPIDQIYDLAELYRLLAPEGNLAGHEVFNRFYEIGTPASLEETRRYLQDKKLP